MISTGSTPYVDFAIFGPYGRRLLRKLTFISYHYNAPEGTWKRLELPGPPDFEAWWGSWLVLKCTFLLLGGFKPERLDLYGEHLRSFLTKYGQDCWFIMYQADIRMRAEHFERIRRRLQINFDAGKIEFEFDPKSPWDTVFTAAVQDREFWDSEIRDKALLYLAKVSTYRVATDDGTTHMSFSRGPYPPSKGQGQKRKPTQQDHSKGGIGKGQSMSKGYSPSPAHHNGNGHETCNKWNLGQCHEPCPNSRSHSCSKCGGNHTKEQCTSPSSSSKPPGKGGKGKETKSKGK